MEYAERQAALLLAAVLAAFSAGGGVPGAEQEPDADGAPIVRSPCELAYSPDGRWLAVSDATAGEVAVVSASEARVLRHIRCGGRPAGLAWTPDGALVYVAVTERGALAEIDPATGATRRWLAAGLRPVGVAFAPRRDLLLAADEAAGEVLALERATGRIRARAATARAPWGLVVSPDERLAVVGHRLPAGDASEPGVSATVALIDLESFTRVTEIALPANSTNLRGLAVSADGRWAYVVHTLARATWPATQIEYGGICASALSVIELDKRRRHATVLLDRTEQGCADPWGVALSPDGDSLWVSTAGTHQVVRVNLARLRSELAKRASLLAFLRRANRKGPVSGGLASERSPLMDDPATAELVVSEKPSQVQQGIGCACGMGVFLPGIISRSDVAGLGPRGIAVTPDGGRVAVATYFSGAVAVLDPRNTQAVQRINLGAQPPLDAARRGEIAFHDARLCHQQWLSCATCHPDGRVDGLNWDLMNDGVGNPKNTRSLVLSHRTAPVMSRGARESFEAAVAAGFKHVLFREGSPQVRQDVEAWLRGLQPEPSPFLVKGKLSRAAQRGRELFEDPRVGCARCHVGEQLTDLKPHDVGTRTDADWPEETAFLTPKLLELWRTGPYLHHGRAVTLREVLTRHNREDRRGATSHLDEVDIEALVEYLKSL